VISILAKETDPARLTDTLPEILDFVHERLAALRNRKIPLEELVVDQTLSRELDRYGVLSRWLPLRISWRIMGKQWTWVAGLNLGEYPSIASNTRMVDFY
jgi:hypothetical protein